MGGAPIGYIPGGLDSQAYLTTPAAMNTLAVIVADVIGLLIWW